MFKNYFKVAFRHLVRHKGTTAINILGLTLGICACLVIYLFTSFELSYDSFQPDKERIYRVVSTFQKSAGDNQYLSMAPDPLAGVIERDFTGIENVTEFHNYYTNVKIPNGKNEPKEFYAAKEREEASEIVIADPQYFDIFKYQWLAGNAGSLLEPFHVVLTESKAIRYFGSLPFYQMIGKQITYNDSLRVFVSGIVKDYPENSDLIFKDFISAATIQAGFLKNKYETTNWQNWARNSQIFVKLKTGTPPGQFETNTERLGLVKKYMDQGDYAKVLIGLQPLPDIHFNASYEDSYGRRVSRSTLYGLMAIAAFILIIASINFINLSTAQSLRRAKEIGIRKVLGSRRSGLTLQFFSETLLLAFLSLLLSLASAPLLLSVFHSLVPDGVRISITPVTLLFVLGVTIITSLIAGLYPARVLSSYTPIERLKGENRQKGSSKHYFRKGLTVFQFTISLVFIISALVIRNQIQ